MPATMPPALFDAAATCRKRAAVAMTARRDARREFISPATTPRRHATLRYVRRHAR